MTPFVYPETRTRRHGPEGYTDYASFAPWLRDEFTFRCAYCLRRERWVRGTSDFVIDHLKPVSARPDLVVEYSNLIYSCAKCNQSKGDATVADPVSHLTASSVVVNADGTASGLTRSARRLIRVVDLNDPEAVEFRRQWLAIIRLAEAHDPELFARLMGFPDDLPDLAALKPPSNARPEGVGESFHARKQRGELPATY